MNETGKQKFHQLNILLSIPEMNRRARLFSAVPVTSSLTSVLVQGPVDLL